MSAGYIKQILLDYGLNRLPFELRTDIIISIEQTIRAGILKCYDVCVLDYYLQGYTIEEISHNIYISAYPLPYNQPEYISASLEHSLLAVAGYSGLTDEWFLQEIKEKYQLPNHKITRAQVYLEEYGKDYTIHEPIEKEEYEYIISR